jgi:hypothetical protein
MYTVMCLMLKQILLQMLAACECYPIATFNQMKARTFNLKNSCTFYTGLNTEESLGGVQ